MTYVAIWEGVVEETCGPKTGYWFYSSNDGLESFSIGQLVELLLAALVAVALMLPIVVAAVMTSEANDWFLPVPYSSAVRDAYPSIAGHQTE